MSEMVERVGDAIWAEMGKGNTNRRDFARAAIEALKPLTVPQVIEMTSDGVLVGLVMKLTGGSANPVVIEEILTSIRNEALK